MKYKHEWWMNTSCVILILSMYMKVVGKKRVFRLKTQNGENGGWKQSVKFFLIFFCFYGIWSKHVSFRVTILKTSAKNRLFMLWNRRNRPLIELVALHAPGVVFFEACDKYFWCILMLYLYKNMYIFTKNDILMGLHVPHIQYGSMC